MKIQTVNVEIPYKYLARRIANYFYHFYYKNNMKPTLTWKSYNRFFSHKKAAQGYLTPPNHDVRIKLNRW